MTKVIKHNFTLFCAFLIILNPVLFPDIGYCLPLPAPIVNPKSRPKVSRKVKAQLKATAQFGFEIPPTSIVSSSDMPTFSSPSLQAAELGVIGTASAVVGITAFAAAYALGLTGAAAVGVFVSIATGAQITISTYEKISEKVQTLNTNLRAGTLSVSAYRRLMVERGASKEEIQANINIHACRIKNPPGFDLAESSLERQGFGICPLSKNLNSKGNPVCKGSDSDSSDNEK